MNTIGAITIKRESDSMYKVNIGALNINFILKDGVFVVDNNDLLNLDRFSHALVSLVDIHEIMQFRTPAERIHYATHGYVKEHALYDAFYLLIIRAIKMIKEKEDVNLEDSGIFHVILFQTGNMLAFEIHSIDKNLDGNGFGFEVDTAEEKLGEIHPQD